MSSVSWDMYQILVRFKGKVFDQCILPALIGSGTPKITQKTANKFTMSEWRCQQKFEMGNYLRSTKIQVTYAVEGVTDVKWNWAQYHARMLDGRRRCQEKLMSSNGWDKLLMMIENDLNRLNFHTIWPYVRFINNKFNSHIYFKFWKF